MSSGNVQVGKYTPGSNSAIQVGCTCSRILNHYGLGAVGNGEVRFTHSGDCPLHGDKGCQQKSAVGPSAVGPSVVCPDDMQTRGGV